MTATKPLTITGSYAGEAKLCPSERKLLCRLGKLPCQQKSESRPHPPPASWHGVLRAVRFTEAPEESPGSSLLCSISRLHLSNLRHRRGLSKLDFLPPPLLCPYPLPPPTPSLSLPPLYPTPPPLLLLFFSSMLDTSVWHVFPIRPVLRYRETGNHLQPQTHPDAGNWAETVAAQPWRQPQDTVQHRQPPQASFHQTLPTLLEWAGACAGRERWLDMP